MGGPVMSNVPKGTLFHTKYVPCYFWVVPKVDGVYASYIKVWVPVKVKISASSIPTNNPRKIKNVRKRSLYTSYMCRREFSTEEKLFGYGNTLVTFDRLES